MQAYQQIEMFEASAELKQQKQFLSILHHDADTRGGFVVRTSFKPYTTEHWGRTGQALTVEHSNADTYVSINSFRKKSRLADLSHSINAFYFDLDWHSEDNGAELSERIKNTRRIISAGSDRGFIPYPTMITHTGRGIGLFYVLERSIANTLKTAKQLRFYKYLYKALADQIEDALTSAELPVLELDRKVIGDRSRVCRLPGTINTKTGTVCKLADVNIAYGSIKYYSLNEIASFINTYKVYPEPAEKNNVIDIHTYKASPMLAKRLQKLTRAQEVFRDNVGNRELLCFYYFNTAYQVYPTEQAVELLRTYNDGFKHPVADHELQNIIRSVSKRSYKILDSTIIDKLELKQKVARGELTQDQLDYIGLGKSSKEIQREASKEETKRKRAERDNAIISYITMNPKSTYKEIAGLFAVSVRTVNNIVKKYELNRYNVQNLNSEPVEASETASGTAAETFGTAENMKVQKIALVSSCCDMDPIINSYMYVSIAVDKLKPGGEP